jgi:hypothetical protein
MKRGKQKREKKLVKALALSEIFMFMISTIAFAFIFSMSFGIVSGATENTVSLNQGNSYIVKYNSRTQLYYIYGKSGVNQPEKLLGTATSITDSTKYNFNTRLHPIIRATDIQGFEPDSRIVPQGSGQNYIISSDTTLLTQNSEPVPIKTIIPETVLNDIETESIDKVLRADYNGDIYGAYSPDYTSFAKYDPSTGNFIPAPDMNRNQFVSLTPLEPISPPATPSPTTPVSAPATTTPVAGAKTSTYNIDSEILEMEMQGLDLPEAKTPLLLSGAQLSDLTPEEEELLNGDISYIPPIKIDENKLKQEIENPSLQIVQMGNASRDYTNIFGKEKTYTTGTIGALGANLQEGLKWSIVILGVVETLGKAFLSEEQFSVLRAAEQAAIAGIMTYKSVYGAFEMSKTAGVAADGKTLVYGAEKNYGFLTGKQWAIGAGVLAAYFVFASQYEKDKERTASIEFKCMPWQAPRGGSDCNKCNGNPLQPCSEYRCKSLGQTCMLINKGTGQERCIDSSPNDVTSPGIKPDTNVLTKGYQYTDRKDRPPGGEGPAHVTIKSATGGCLKAFTAFEFGIITTDKGTSGDSTVTQPAQCKIDYNHTISFDEMNYYMGDDNLFVENHSQRISLPGTDLLNKTFPGVKNDGEYTLYIRCKDGNGNENRDEYAVRFCIDKSPDLSAPVISKISIPSGSPILYKVDNLSIGVYTNEPANCRWSRKDSSYSNMENQMSCSNNVWEMNAELLYTCITQLTSIKDKEENNFYFRCTDLSNNTMQQSYNYKLIGTQPLNILSTGPSGTIGSSTSTAVINLSVQTDNGYKNGEARCYYSPTGSEKDYVEMFETGGSSHYQSLDLIGGNYKYYFKCVDAGGNTAYNNTNFTVYIDKYAPEITRIYSLEDKLILTTDEDSTCGYSTSSCNFKIEEGISMPIDLTKNHYAEWKTEQTYYIKCKDRFNNEPNPAECLITIRPYSLAEEEL